MPDTIELLEWAERIASREMTFDEVPWDDLVAEERTRLAALLCYELERRPGNPIRSEYLRRQRKACGLLRSILDEEQNQSLTKSGSFFVRGSAGGVYRLHPDSAHVTRVERHGTRWFAIESFCLHDEHRELPPADLSIVHMMWIRTDELRFRATANVRKLGLMMWDSAWRSRLAAARKARDSKEGTVVAA